MNTELKNRWIWGVLSAVVVIVTLLFLGPEASFLLATGAGVLGWREYCRLMGLRERPSFHYLGYILIGLMFTHSFFVGSRTLFWVWFVWVLAFLTVFIEYMIEKRRSSISTFDIQRTWTELCRFILGVFYVYMIFGFFGPVLSKVNGEQIVILALASTFLSDTSAYFVGKARGRRKLWPELSPGKTIEGAVGGWIGGFLAALIVGALFRYVLFPGTSLTMVDAVIVGFFAGPLSQAGDFLESLMKRVAGRKDSGSLIPGHGGILDRTDGLVFVMPLVYFLF